MKQTFNTLKIISLALILSFGLSYAIAWTAPSTTPPTGNVSAPINTGSTTASQTITGKLTVTATTTTGSLVAGGLGLFASSLTTNEILFPDGTKQATAGGNFAAVNQYTSATTLTIANDGGRLVELGGGGSYNLTLPISSSGSGGKRISFVAYGGGPFYLVPQGSDCLWLTTKCVGYVTIASPGYAAVTSNGVGAWTVDSGTPLSSAYSLQVLPGTSTHLYQTACRMNTLNGATTCFLSTAAVTPQWTSTASPFSATTNGSYALVCSAGSPSHNYPICCRFNNSTGTTECKITQDVGGSWIASSNPF